MPGRDIVVIGGSAGALDAVRSIAAALPGGLQAAIFVVLHVSASAPGVLDRLLTRSGSLPARYPNDGDPIELGYVYAAPPDHHLLVKEGHVRVTRGPRENGFRPAVDPLFRTAAVAYGARVIGIVLSGGQDDGAAGLAEIKRQGGVAIAQDLEEALMPSMPQAAMLSVDVDHVLAARAIGGRVVELVGERAKIVEDRMHRDDLPDAAEAGTHAIHHAQDLGPPSPFSCPDCGGTLWQSQSGELIRFQCHVGHRYNGDSLVAAQSDALEKALWTALRALDESSELRRRMARHAYDRGMAVIGESYETQARESEDRASAIRRVLMPGGRAAGTTPQSPPDRMALKK